MTVAKIIVRNVITSDNKNGITTISSSLKHKPELYLSYTSIIGLGLTNCVECYADDLDTCTHLRGLRAPTAMGTSEILPGKLKMPIHRVKVHAPFTEGSYSISNIEFKNFVNFT